MSDRTRIDLTVNNEMPGIDGQVIQLRFRTYDLLQLELNMGMAVSVSREDVFTPAQIKIIGEIFKHIEDTFIFKTKGSV